MGFYLSCVNGCFARCCWRPPVNLLDKLHPHYDYINSSELLGLFRAAKYVGCLCGQDCWHVVDTENPENVYEILRFTVPAGGRFELGCGLPGEFLVHPLSDLRWLQD
jgi:hypothetical protein